MSDDSQENPFLHSAVSQQEAQGRRQTPASRLPLGRGSTATVAVLGASVGGGAGALLHGERLEKTKQEIATLQQDLQAPHPVGLNPVEEEAYRLELQRKNEMLYDLTTKKDWLNHPAGIAASTVSPALGGTVAGAAVAGVIRRRREAKKDDEPSRG